MGYIDPTRERERATESKRENTYGVYYVLLIYALVFYVEPLLQSLGKPTLVIAHYPFYSAIRFSLLSIFIRNIELQFPYVIFDFLVSGQCWSH
jgi:hypothetical protein